MECDAKVVMDHNLIKHVENEHKSLYQAIVHTRRRGEVLHFLPSFLPQDDAPKSPDVDVEVKEG